MTNIESLKADPPKPWGIIATALWVLVTTLIFIVASTVALLALWAGGKLDRSQDLVSNGPLLSLVIVVWTVVQIEVLAWAARRRGWQAGDYLGWIVPNPREAAVTLAVIVALILALDALNYLLDIDLVSPWQINTYRSAREAGGLVMLWITFVA